MSLADPEIPSTAAFDKIAEALSQTSDAEKQKQIDATKATFELRIKNKAGKEGIYTIDMKNKGTVTKGPAKPKADATISMSDESFAGLISGKSGAQKLFMTGNLKIKGSIVVATKELDGVLKPLQSKM